MEFICSKLPLPLLKRAAANTLEEEIQGKLSRAKITFTILDHTKENLSSFVAKCDNEALYSFAEALGIKRPYFSFNLLHSFSRLNISELKTQILNGIERFGLAKMANLVYLLVYLFCSLIPKIFVIYAIN